MDPRDLVQILDGLPHTGGEGLLVGARTLDDAAVVRWTPGSARLLLQTVDFITPLVDDAYTFGQIAAANALSDIYAMGGQPRIALNIAAFPAKVLDQATLRAILVGAADTMGAAGGLIVGGHTVRDDTVKFGLAVTGEVEEADLLTNAGGRPGDRLVLTKPLGTALLFEAFRDDQLGADLQHTWIESMVTTNAAAAAAAVKVGAHAATDVTGFGLAGHAMQLGQASGCDVIFEGELPALPGARALASKGVRGAAQRNADYLGARLQGAEDPVVARLLTDPQTSGGLLLAVAPEREEALLGALHDASVPASSVGCLSAGEGRVLVR